MVKVKMYNTSGAEAGEIELNGEVFAREYNEALIHQVIVAQLNNKRQGTKSTLTRAEVRGGGVKPWRQKGTGRARQGSNRSPQWTGGGVVFAPKPRDYSQKINKSAKREALKCALSEKIREGSFTVLDELKLSEAKTKQMVSVLKNLNISGRILLVTSKDDGTVYRAARNIEGVYPIDASLINVYDVVANKNLLITADAVKEIEEAYAQ
ncbi:MAG: 50S ribosomal protein L4 [Christensenellales bacterium]|jgi:large subunit ribosomal protein L4